MGKIKTGRASGFFSLQIAFTPCFMSFQEQLEDKTRLNENLEKQLLQRYVFQKKSEKKIWDMFCLNIYVLNHLSVCLCNCLLAYLPVCLSVYISVCLTVIHPDKGLTQETLALKLFTVANLCYQFS